MVLVTEIELLNDKGDVILRKWLNTKQFNEFMREYKEGRYVGASDWRIVGQKKVKEVV